MSLSLLDANQIIQDVFDEPNDALRVSGIGPSGSTVITATSPIPVFLSSASNLDVIATARIDFSNLTTSYFTVIPSAPSAFSKIAIYDTSGADLQLAIGPSGSEVLKSDVGPGCDQVFEFIVPSGSRVAVRTVGSNAVAGNLVLNFIGAV